MDTKEKLRRLRKACREQRKERMEFIDILRFYGDRENYSWRTGSRPIPVLDEDGGRRAREVLKKISKGKNK